VGHRVVFEDDELGAFFERPLKPRRHPPSTPKVDIRVVAKNLAVPIHPIDDPSNRLTLFALSGPPFARTIGKHEQL
jgi:hypothetical protein